MLFFGHLDKMQRKGALIMLEYLIPSVVSIITFVLGYYTANLQIKRQRERELLKEKYFDVLLPAMRKICGLVYIGIPPMDGMPMDVKNEILLFLNEKDYLLPKGIRKKLFFCSRISGSADPRFDEAFSELALLLSHECRRVALLLGYETDYE